MPTDVRQSENRERLKSAVLAIQTLQTQLASAKAAMREPIAVIGMGCRFPGGAINPESYWQLLRGGRYGTCEIPDWRWPVEEYYSADPDEPGRMYVRRGGFVDGIERFDADFFGISTREALRLDPQQRLLLEVMWEALEDAAIAPYDLAGSNTGVFVGITSSDYGEIVRAAGNEYLDAYQMTGSHTNFGPGRIAYFLGLHGPAMAIDTACSSSLVAVDTACRSLRTGQCDLALAGGANALLLPDGFVTECKARMLSPDGCCKTFDAAANGFVRGEGAGVVILKRLADAEADGDRILAVILGSAVNQDGKSSGLTVPNRHAQEAVIRKALEFAAIAPSEIQYVEAHGTATPLGDPIEVRALANVFRQGREPAKPLYLGSVKTNIGHLESAAGIAGLLKVILSLRHREIPPHLNLHRLTPHVEWDQIPVRVNTELTSWPEGGSRRLAGISSFGASGTNCHVVVGEAPETPTVAAGPKLPLHLLTVSARTESSLQTAVSRLADHLHERPELAIEDVCRTANVGRVHFPHRLSVLCGNTTEAEEKLYGFLSSHLNDGVMVSHHAGVEREFVAGGTLNLPPLDPDCEDPAEMMVKLQVEYHSGAAIDWKALDQRMPGRKISLPTYPFERERFWVEYRRPTPGVATISSASAGRQLHSLLGVPLDSPAIEGRVFEAALSACEPAFLQDHRICGRVVLPAAAYVEMAFAAARQLFGESACIVQDLDLQEVLPLATDTRTRVQFILSSTVDNKTEFRVCSTTGQCEDSAKVWTQHSTGSLIRVAETGPDAASTSELIRVRNRCSEPANIERFYEQLADNGVEFGRAFRNLHALYRGNGESLAEIRLADCQSIAGTCFLFHPVLLDACFVSAAESVVSASADAEGNEILLPIGIESIRITRKVPNTIWCHGRLRGTFGNEARTSILDLDIFDQNGQITATVSGLKLRWVSRNALGRIERVPADWLYEIQWHETPPYEMPTAATVDPLGPRGSWLILADTRGLGEMLGARLTSIGHRCIFARHSSGSFSHGKNNFELNPENSADFMRLIEESDVTGEMPLLGVVHLWSLDGGDTSGMSRKDLENAQLLGCGAALHLVQALALLKTNSPPLCLVTRGAQAAGKSSVAGSAHGAALWGLGSVIAVEHPELRCRRFDLDPESLDSTGDANTLFGFLRSESAEADIAARRTIQLGPRLVRLPVPKAASVQDHDLPFSQPFRLEIAEAGIIENLSWIPNKLDRLKPDEVQIEVRAAGLNFRDVLCALGMYPGNAGRLGGECAGIVVRVGRNVETVKPGDLVMALAPGGLATHVNVRADYAVRVPAGMSVAEAASLPAVFLTTFYGLHHLSRIKSGDRVLIHAAAGGVGLAAVQLAQRAGAEIFATAGSPAKRDHLRGLGIAHVYDSRSLDFADEIMRDSNGRGVDIVLNSLAGEFIAKSVSVLAAGGRFVELGKRGILTHDEFAAKRNDCEYYAFDMAEEAHKDPSLVPMLFADLCSAFEKKTLHALPITTFEAGQVADAFRFMSHARHIGKIVISEPTEALVRTDVRRSTRTRIRIHSEGTYLITGAFGGLGIESVRWLIGEGARNLMLIGRHAPDNGTQFLLDEFVRDGTRIVIKTCDVADEAQIDAALTELASSMPGMRGVIHAAGVLDDGTLAEQTWDRFERVMLPKVYGAWNLHRLTTSSDLDFFVLFSSAAGIIGSPGQGNYAAANAFMDALAHQRKAIGLPALSVDWGTWAEVGMAARLESPNAQRWHRRGMQPIAVAEGFAKLGEMIGLERAQIVAMKVDWSRFLGDRGSGRNDAFFAEIAEAPLAPTGTGKPEGAENELVRRISAEPAYRRLPVLQAHVESIARSALGTRAGKSVDPRQPLHAMGLDSLMAVELRNSLAASLGRSLPATVVFDHPTVESLAQYLAKDVLHLEFAQDVAEGELTKASDNGLNDLQNLTDAQAEALLVTELERARQFADE